MKNVTKEELKEMAGVDIREVDIDSLTDIADVRINTDLPVEERIADYIRQVGNPYCYRSHGVAVKISFSGKTTLEDCLAACMEFHDTEEI